MGWMMRRGAGSNKPRYSSHNRQECIGGCRFSQLKRLSPRWHHSGEEAHYCNQLFAILQEGREIRSYRSQVRYDLHDAHGKSCGYMMVDFEIVSADNTLSLIEYKGKHLMNTPEFRHKKAILSWCYPKIKYTVANKNDRVI